MATWPMAAWLRFRFPLHASQPSDSLKVVPELLADSGRCTCMYIDIYINIDINIDIETQTLGSCREAHQKL